MCSDIGIIAIKITVQILFFEESMDEFSPFQRSIGYCWRISFKVLGVLFIAEVSPAFLPSKKAYGIHKFQHFWVRQQYPNSNQWYFNNLVKRPCHKTPYRCPHRLNLSSQSSRSCALPNIKALKDKDLEFANSIPSYFGRFSCQFRKIEGME
jgi:hypothetical protein